MVNEKGKSLLTGIVIGALIVVGLGAAYYFGKQSTTFDSNPLNVNQVNNIKSPEPKSETSDWETYTNSTFHYSIKYPNDWKLVSAETTDTDVTFSGPSAENAKPPLIAIHAIETSKFKESDIANYTPITYKVLENNGYKFLIVASTYQLGTSTEEISKIEPKAKEVFDKMIPTLKFTPN